MTHIGQQYELDFGDASKSSLTCGAVNVNQANNYIYNSHSSSNSAGHFSFPPQTSDLTITCDDLLFTTNGQTKSLFKMISKIEERLSILVPDPAKLEQFEALRRAYENYKTLEAICFTNNE